MDTPDRPEIFLFSVPSVSKSFRENDYASTVYYGLIICDSLDPKKILLILFIRVNAFLYSLNKQAFFPLFSRFPNMPIPYILSIRVNTFLLLHTGLERLFLRYNACPIIFPFVIMFDTKNKSSNVVWHQATVTRARRQAQNGHRGTIIWFTGLSGSGKSTLAHAVEEELHQRGCKTFVLDGDNVRHGLCGDLGFSEEDRSENIRRIGQTAKLFVESGMIVLTAFISPFQVDRQRVRMMVENDHDFLEIYCQCALDVCENRDVKGLYQRARKGEITDFTGISSPYEQPENADLTLNTAELEIQQCVDEIIKMLASNGLISSQSAAVKYLSAKCSA